MLESLPEPQGRASVVQAMIFSGLPEAGGQNYKASSIPGPRNFLSEAVETDAMYLKE